MKIIALNHVPYERPGYIADWAADRQADFQEINVYEGNALPELNSFDCLVVMGGPMGVYDEAQYDWMPAEKAFLKAALQEGKKMLGICLGAQLLAEALGARVYPAKEKEIGWFPVQATAPHPINHQWPNELMAFHWHGDTFDVPRGAKVLARSEATPNQAFMYQNRILGLQFHLEIQKPLIEALMDNNRHELQPAAYVQSAGEINRHIHLARRMHPHMHRLLDAFATMPKM